MKKIALFFAMIMACAAIAMTAPPMNPASSVHVETYAVKGVSFEMTKVDGGTFMMGSNDGYSDEMPVHSETVATFYIGKTEVTQDLWMAVMGGAPSNFIGGNLPVENVSWNDCQEFIRRLNELTGKVFRLPSEVEWEYAARGGNLSHGYKYSGSDDIDSVAWYCDQSGRHTNPVATKAPNELGIFDMSGNVWEWTSDIYSNDYDSPRSCEYYVGRGGSWGDDSQHCQISHRYYASPVDAYENLGLRLAL